jgi:hypothetical protein
MRRSRRSVKVKGMVDFFGNLWVSIEKLLKFKDFGKGFGL